VSETPGSGAVLRPVTASASVMLAPNPSPMTLEGTNTWLLRGQQADGGQQSPGFIVIDAGPPDESHLARVAAVGPIELILLTHGHPDHSGGSARLAELTGASVLALDRRFGEPLAAGDSLRQCGVALDVIGTPGHSADSLSFYLPADDAVLTGDTILGRGTTVVAWPDGQLGPYLDSLQRLREFGDAAVLPGHGPELPSAGRVAEDYLAHRAERLAKVAKAVAAGARTPREVVEIVYTDVPEVLWAAAELSVHAQLDYLVEQTPSLADQLDRTPTPANEMAARMAEASLVRSAGPPG
jgi:glyoxylase-like metal-dependent hydrolase (beta-lactamase superfamily II)